MTAHQGPLARLLQGPPPAWPPLVDRAAERWARTPPRLRLVVAAGALLALLGVVGRGAVSSPWSETATVWVAATTLPAGHVLTPDDLRPVARPVAALPSGALVSDTTVTGSVLALGLAPGAALTDAHLASGGLGADLPPGRVALAVPTPLDVEVRVGATVDVVGSSTDGRASVVARAARVLAVTAEVTWLDLTRDEAPAVAGAAAWGQVWLAVLPVGGASNG